MTDKAEIELLKSILIQSIKRYSPALVIKPDYRVFARKKWWTVKSIGFLHRIKAVRKCPFTGKVEFSFLNRDEILDSVSRPHHGRAYRTYDVSKLKKLEQALT